MIAVHDISTSRYAACVHHTNTTAHGHSNAAETRSGDFGYKTIQFCVAEMKHFDDLLFCKHRCGKIAFARVGEKRYDDFPLIFGVLCELSRCPYRRA